MTAAFTHVSPPSVEVARRSGERLLGESLYATTSVLLGIAMTSICRPSCFSGQSSCSTGQWLRLRFHACFERQQTSGGTTPSCDSFT